MDTNQSITPRKMILRSRLSTSITTSSGKSKKRISLKKKKMKKADHLLTLSATRKHSVTKFYSLPKMFPDFKSHLRKTSKDMDTKIGGSSQEEKKINQVLVDSPDRNVKNISKRSKTHIFVKVSKCLRSHCLNLLRSWTPLQMRRST